MTTSSAKIIEKAIDKIWYNLMFDEDEIAAKSFLCSTLTQALTQHDREIRRMIKKMITKGWREDSIPTGRWYPFDDGYNTALSDILKLFEKESK